jgi:large subunit ribosomal protein L15
VKLHDLHPASGSRRQAKRVGRGHGSGKGKTAGRGTKGQKARGSLQPWFEGGQTPLHMRTPKLHGFTNRFRIGYVAVNVGELEKSPAGSLITPDTIRTDGLVPNRRSKPTPIKILGEGEAPRGVTIHAHAFSRSALAKLEAVGSTAQRLSWPDGSPIPMTEPELEPAAKPRDRKRPKAEAEVEQPPQSEEKETGKAGESEPEG